MKFTSPTKEKRELKDKMNRKIFKNLFDDFTTEYMKLYKETGNIEYLEMAKFIKEKKKEII